PRDIAPAVGDSSHGYGDSIISPDDVLEVYVMDVPELSRQYRVSPSGTVDLPLLPNSVPAAGLTPSQLSDAVAKQLRNRGLVTNPHIVITIVSSRVKAVSITGAVKMPQIYPVFGRTTLLDVLSQSQGANLTRPNNFPKCWRRSKARKSLDSTSGDGVTIRSC